MCIHIYIYIYIHITYICVDTYTHMHIYAYNTHIYIMSRLHLPPMLVGVGVREQARVTENMHVRSVY